jgi:integrase
LHPSVIERFTAHSPGLSGPARRTLRTSLRFIARAVVPHLDPADAPLPRGRAKAPYPPAEIDGFLALADAQPTAARAMRAAACRIRALASRPGSRRLMNDTTYNARIYKTKVRQGKTVTTYYVRWKVGSRLWEEPYRTAAQADSFRSSLLTAARNGEPFSLATGRPVSWLRTSNDMNWYEFACAYTDMKWKSAAAKYRKSIARALTAATPAMFTVTTRGKPDDADIRRALLRWGFNTKQRAILPADVEPVLAWVADNTAMLSTLTEPTNARRLLDTATTLLDGRNAAPTTARRHRMILANAMDYAMELKLLDGNPVRQLKWKALKISGGVDRRCVVNPRQARALLEAVRGQEPSGPRLVVFFGVMYYAGLRPEEAVNLRKGDVTLPPMRWNKATKQWDLPLQKDDWGELHFRQASPDAGGEWTDDGKSASFANSSTEPRATSASSRPIPSCPGFCASILSASARPDPMAGCSAVLLAVNCRLSRTGAPGRRHGASHSPRRNSTRRLPAAPTTCGTHACPPGSTAACNRPRSPSTRVTASTCSSASTPSASPGRTS